MRTEDMPLDVKSIFDRKGMKYSRFDVARARYMLKIILEFILDRGK